MMAFRDGVTILALLSCTWVVLTWLRWRRETQARMAAREAAQSAHLRRVDAVIKLVRAVEFTQAFARVQRIEEPRA